VTKTTPLTYSKDFRKNLNTANEQVRTKMDNQLLCQKTLYEKKINGDPYKEGGLIGMATFNSAPKRILKKTVPPMVRTI